MDLDQKDELHCLVNRFLKWIPYSIPFTIDGFVFNLIDYIGKDCVIDRDKELHFPSEYGSTDKPVREKLARALKIAASEAGFLLVVKGWDARRCMMIFKC